MSTFHHIGFGEAKIYQPDPAIFSNHDIRRLDIPVANRLTVLSVHIIERTTDNDPIANGLSPGHSTTALEKDREHGTSFDILHDQIVVTLSREVIINFGNIRMAGIVELRQQFSLSLKVRLVNFDLSRRTFRNEHLLDHATPSQLGI